MTRFLVAAFLTGVLVTAGCVPGGPRPQESGDVIPGAGAAPSVKRVVAAIQGDPATLSAAINSAGSGRVRGVAEVDFPVTVP